jgi:hypothetical protein
MKIKLVYEVTESQFTNLGNKMCVNIHFSNADVTAVYQHTNSRISAARQLSVDPAVSNEVVIPRINNGLAGALIGS